MNQQDNQKRQQNKSKKQQHNQIQQNNNKRQLPKRSNRGIRLSLTQQQKQQDDQLYNKLFGTNQNQSDDESFSQILGLRPLQIFSANFSLYNYGRGYHYFFDLDSFPRVQNSPSYASDENNRFGHTFSQDQKQINGIKLKQLFNRKYIGLPSTQTTWGNTKSRDKNVCHYHLFNIQDKKFNNSRLIRKYKTILKNIKQLTQNNKLKYFTELKKDVVMYEICEKQTPIQRKKEILQNRIKVLQQRVKNMYPYWDWEDRIYYHFSLDQVFHNDAMIKGQKLSEKYLANYIVTKITERKNYIEGIQYGQLYLGVQKLKDAIETWLQYEQQENNALSTTMQNRLKAMPKIIEMFRKKEEIVIFPLFTFNFGSVEIARYIDHLIKSKLQDEDQSCFYVYKAFIKRLLKRDLACPEGNVNEPIIIEQYTHQMRRKIVQIQDFYKNDLFCHKKIIYLDDLVQMKKIQNSQTDEKIHLLECEQKIEINVKELMLLFFYRNISIALEQFLDYMKFDPEILKFISNSNYQKYHYGIAKILHKPQFCILINDLNRFANILSNKDVFPGFAQIFHFTFNKNLGVGYAWKQDQSDDWETERDYMEELEEECEELINNQIESHPIKKIKRD